MPDASQGHIALDVRDSTPAPVLLGDGIRLFDPAEGRRIKLEKASIAESGRLTDLTFRVLG